MAIVRLLLLCSVMLGYHRTYPISANDRCKDKLWKTRMATIGGLAAMLQT